MNILSVARSCLLHRTSSVVISAPPQGFGIFGLSNAGLPRTAHHAIGTRIVSWPFHVPGASTSLMTVTWYAKGTTSTTNEIKRYDIILFNFFSHCKELFELC